MKIVQFLNLNQCFLLLFPVKIFFIKNLKLCCALKFTCFVTVNMITCKLYQRFVLIFRYFQNNIDKLEYWNFSKCFMFLKIAQILNFFLMNLFQKIAKKLFLSNVFVYKLYLIEYICTFLCLLLLTIIIHVK